MAYNNQYQQRQPFPPNHDSLQQPVQQPMANRSIPVAHQSSPYPVMPNTTQKINNTRQPAHSSIGQPVVSLANSINTLNLTNGHSHPPQMNQYSQNNTNPTQPKTQYAQTTPLSANTTTGKRRPYPQQIAPSIPTVNRTNQMNHNQLNQQPNQINQQPAQLPHQQPAQLPHQQPAQLPHQQPAQLPHQQLNYQHNQQQEYQQQSYPQQSYPQQPYPQNNFNQSQNQSLNQTYSLNLLEQRQIIGAKHVPPKAPMAPDQLKKNANPGILRCTFNAIPQTSSLQKKSKLPFGIHIHPFKDDVDIPVISTVITRCRSCRSYLNPFVTIPDHRRWQCNICFRLNDIPEGLTFDQATRQYTDIRRRPELNYSSVEFIAPSEYMLRPPQPAIYMFVLDVSVNAVLTGYLRHACNTLIENIDNLPGDSRTKIGFITFNSVIHFYGLKANQNQPQMYAMTDIDDVFLPVPDGLLVNVKENKEMILQLLEALPDSFAQSTDTDSCTGAAMSAARKMMTTTGGRVTVFQTCLPNTGPGALKPRELSSMSPESKDTQFLNPSTDHYKTFALECAGEQIAVDLFVMASQYIDIASLSCVSRYSSGAIHYFPDFHAENNIPMLEKFQHDFRRYLTRNIGFEAVMRLRCTRGLSIHSFHGNFFVRSTDLLSLPNVNPDHSFSMQMAVEDPLTDTSMVGFQAALLYTTTKGERRIRVHTLALPVTSKLSDIYQYADEEAIISSLSKLAVDKTLMSSLGDAREALLNACIDSSKTYREELSGQPNCRGVVLPHHLRLLPLHVLAIMKNDAFKLGSHVSLDRRAFSLLEFKWQPLENTMASVYPKMYSLLGLNQAKEENSGPPVMHASVEKLSRQGVYLMDNSRTLFIFVGRNAPEDAIHCLFNVANVASLPDLSNRLPELNNELNIKAREFISSLRNQRPFFAPLEIIREDGRQRMRFLNNLIDDKTESSMSYTEFLQHIQRQINGQ